jgi:hypothetical protein
VWADALEKKLIADNGGVIQDMDKRLKQTLNIAKGGKGADWWKSNVAFRNKKLNEFKKEMNEFAKEERPSILDPKKMEYTSRVPTYYVNPETGSKLGEKLSHFRSGSLWMGHPDKAKTREWAESLPRWVWKIDFSNDEEWKAGLSARGKARFASEEARVAQSVRATAQFANETPEEKATKIAKMKKTKSTPEAKAVASASTTAMWANATPEVKAAWSAKSKKTKNTPEAKAARSVHSTTMWANRTPEAETARLSKKAATDTAKREAVLSKLTGKPRAAAEKKYAEIDRGSAKRKKDFEKYRIDHPCATYKDFGAAKKAANLAAKEEANAKLAVKKQPKRGALRKRTTTTTVEEEFDPPAKRSKVVSKPDDDSDDE